MIISRDIRAGRPTRDLRTRGTDAAFCRDEPEPAYCSFLLAADFFGAEVRATDLFLGEAGIVDSGIFGIRMEWKNSSTNFIKAAGV